MFRAITELRHWSFWLSVFLSFCLSVFFRFVCDRNSCPFCLSRFIQCEREIVCLWVLLMCPPYQFELILSWFRCSLQLVTKLKSLLSICLFIYLSFYFVYFSISLSANDICQNYSVAYLFLCLIFCFYLALLTSGPRSTHSNSSKQESIEHI
jgi:hypothetical protein